MTNYSADEGQEPSCWGRRKGGHRCPNRINWVVLRDDGSFTLLCSSCGRGQSAYTVPVVDAPIDYRALATDTLDLMYQIDNERLPALQTQAEIDACMARLAMLVDLLNRRQDAPGPRSLRRARA